MDKDFSSCSEPKEVFDELLSELASGYVITEPEGNTFELLKGKFLLTPVQKTVAKTPAKLFEILQQKGTLKSPNVGPLIKCFRDVDQRAIPMIIQAEIRIQQLLDKKGFGTEDWIEHAENLRNNEDFGKILNETIDGMEEDDHADDTSKELKSTLMRLRRKYWSNIEWAEFYQTLYDFNQETRNIYQECRGDVERRIQKADQQPRATVFLRQTLHEDSNLGFGNENSTNVSELLNDLERRGKIGPQKYSYFSNIMNKLDPRLKEIVADAQKKLQNLQKDLLSHLKKMMKELEGGKDLEKCSRCGKRKREDEEEGRSHKRQEINGY